MYDTPADPASLPLLRTVVKTSLAHARWRQEYVVPLRDLVERVNIIISHARLFVKDIFVHADEEDAEAWNLLDKQIFYELVILAVGGHDRKVIEDEDKIQKMNTRARIANQAARLINKHKARFFRQLGLRPVKMKHLHQISHYEGEKIRTSFLNNIQERLGSHLRRCLNLLLDTRGRAKTLKAALVVTGANSEMVKRRIKDEITTPAANLKRQFASSMTPAEIQAMEVQGVAADRAQKIKAMRSLFSTTSQDSL